MAHSGGQPHYLHPNGRIGPISGMKLMELQAEGKLPGPVPAAMMQQVLAGVRAHHGPPNFHGLAHNAKGVGMWAVNSDYNYLIGNTKGGNKTVSAINLSSDNCAYPQTVHVDHSQNAWIGCEYNSSYSSGQVLQLNSAGAFQAGYAPGCPAPTSTCDYWYSYQFDAAANSSDVFAAMPFTEEETCNPSCTYTYGSGFEWWPAGDTTAAPTFINVGESCAPVCNTEFMDLDSSGNIWFSYYGCENSCGGGLAEVTNPTTSPTFVSIIQPGTFECPGGVYISNGGNTLNYIDECQREVFQYAMPVSVSGQPIATLGPTPQNAFYSGEPVTMGFNSADSKLAVGDAAGWVDDGTVAKNHWKAIPNIDFGSYVPGAAFTPSDK